MTNQIVFRFTDGTTLEFKFNTIESTQDAENTAQYIARKLELRGAIRRSKAGDYCRKSSLLPFRKFKIDFYQNSILFESVIRNTEWSAKLATDYEALTDLIETVFTEASL